MDCLTLHELRLVFADQSLAESVFQILSKPGTIGGFSFAPGTVETFEDDYLDTAGHALQIARISLRLRRWRESGRAAWQWKCPAGEITEDLKFTFMEREAAVLESDCLSGLPSDFADRAALALLAKGGPGEAGAELSLVGTVKTIRQRVSVFRNGSEVAQLHLDRVIIEGPLPGRFAQASEIEVTGTDPRDLVHLGETLANWFSLIKVRSSKLERHLPARRPAERLLLDMDPGVDDALALLYPFARPDPPIVDGITIVGGNVPADQCARNAARICLWAKQAGLIASLPAIGIGIDLSEDRDDASNVHGSDGLGDLDWSEIDPLIDLEPFEDAFVLQERVLRAHPGKVTVVATGPCTNLARLTELAPDALELAREVIIMGGAFFNAGNRGPRAEFNVHSDSAAAQKLLGYSRERVPKGQGRPGPPRLPLTFVGLDVTHRTLLERGAIGAIDTPLARLAAGISAKYMDFYHMVNGIDGCPLHDPLALGLALNPTFLVREPYHVEVVSTPESPETDGMTIADHRPCHRFKAHEKAVTEVCVSVDGVAFLNDFLTTMRKTV